MTGAAVDAAVSHGGPTPPGDIETFYRDDQWHNRVEGTFGLLGSYDRKESAATAGRRTALERHVGHVLREPDGRSTRQ